MSLSYSSRHIKNSYNKAPIYATNASAVGGVVGVCEGEIEACYNSANIEASSHNGDSYIGGLAGLMHHTDTYIVPEIKTSYCSADYLLTSNFTAIGGLVGASKKDLAYGGSMLISDSYSLSSLCPSSYTDYSYIGGILGSVNHTATINRCYFAGAIESGDNNEAEGITRGGNAIINLSYFDKDRIKNYNSSDNKGKSTSEMTSQATFNGWDFNSKWTIGEGYSYPYLKENPQFPSPRPR